MGLEDLFRMMKRPTKKKRVCYTMTPEERVIRDRLNRKVKTFEEKMRRAELEKTRIQLEVDEWWAEMREKHTLPDHLSYDPDVDDGDIWEMEIED